MQTRFLAKIPSWLSGLVYLLMIPAFTGIYQTFANEFCPNTAQHEEVEFRQPCGRITHDITSSAC
jgi:hypothetical protein